MGFVSSPHKTTNNIIDDLFTTFAQDQAGPFTEIHQQSSSPTTASESTPPTEPSTTILDPSPITNNPTHHTVEPAPTSKFGSSKFQTCFPSHGQKVVTIKSDRRKLLPNIHVDPLDGISFHSEDGVLKWKYVVQRCIADECEISYQHHFCVAVMNLIRSVGLLPIVSYVGTFYHHLIREFIVNLPTDLNDLDTHDYHKVHIRGKCFNVPPVLLNDFLKVSIPVHHLVTTPSGEQLALEFSTKSWSSNGQFPVTKLSNKYDILNRIGKANWHPTSHQSKISTSLTHLIYQIGSGSQNDVGKLIFQHILPHVDTFEINIHICFPWLLCGFLLSQHSDVLSITEDVGPSPKLFKLNYKLFQRRTHVPDLPQFFHPPKFWFICYCLQYKCSFCWFASPTRFCLSSDSAVSQ
ncbi:hypothetical protein Csa_012710 [Cucumis sativus]|nr:hypothetical protein Csa_012710 [Cucumis sativus]